MGLISAPFFVDYNNSEFLLWRLAYNVLDSSGCGSSG